MFHHILKIISNGKLYEAPISKDVQRVLDIGCVSAHLRLLIEK
jgi:hypothetical protein